MTLVLLLLVPLIGAIACAVMPKPKAARQMALFFSVITLLVAVIAVFQFYAPPADQPVDLGFTGPGLASIGFSFHLGVDAVSLWLIVLTAFLQPLAVAASYGSIHERQKEYYAWMMALLVAMMGVFVSRDALLFYIFFELTLVPMFFIIGIWGGPERRYAAGKFFLFTFTGSVFTLAAAVYLGMKAGSFDITTVVQTAQGLTGQQRFWVVMGFLAGFAVKVPLFPVHTWLPLAHTEAPTAGSVILAGVLLKLGTYGLFRLALPIGLIGPNGSAAFPVLNWWLGVLCVIGIIYGALVAWVQQDIKKLVAYSSVSHLGFCVLGLVALNNIGLQGSVLYMINHGINTGALFLCIGMIYDRYHTRDINALSGLARRMPILAFFFVLFCLASIGLPGTNGFVSEFLTILGAFTSDHLGMAFGTLAALGIVLGAIYILHMVARVIWGPLKTPDVHGHDDAHATPGHGSKKHAHDDKTPGDIGGREIAILVPLAIAVIVLGVKPGLVMDRMLGPSQQTLKFAGVRATPGPTTSPVLLPVVTSGTRQSPLLKSSRPVFAEVNGLPIFGDDVVTSLIEPFHGEAKRMDVNGFREFVFRTIHEQLRILIRHELEFASANQAADPASERLARSIAMKWREQRISAAGGDIDVVRRQFEAEGRAFEHVAEEQYRVFVIQLHLQKRLAYIPETRELALNPKLSDAEQDYLRKRVTEGLTDFRDRWDRELERDAIIKRNQPEIAAAVERVVARYPEWADPQK